MEQEKKDGPLDGSTSDTIGGGGPDTGGPTPKVKAPELPAVDPDNAASGRLASDPVSAAQQPDALKAGRTDVARPAAKEP